MRKGLLVWLAAGVVGVGGSMLLACGSSPSTSGQDPTAQLADGLTVLDARADWGINAAYKLNGHVVFLQARVGALKPQVYRDAFPNDPQHEVDVRFVDEFGNTFRIQRGGDALIDPSWVDTKSATMPLGKISATEIDQHFKLARDGANALAAANLGAEFSESILNTSGFAHQVPSEMPDMMARAKAAAPPLAQQALSTDSNYNWFEGDEYGGCVDPFCIAHHGTVDMWNCAWTGNSASPCTWNLEVGACNHGRCPWDSGMSYKCSTGADNWVYNNEVDTLTIQSRNTSNSGTGINGACSSGYNWDTPPGHECNEDTAYELWQIKNSSTSTTQGNSSTFYWHDANGHNYECYCGTHSNCSGDWSNPSCP